MAANDAEEVARARSHWNVVQRDQCRGSDLRCVNCGEPLHAQHRVLCYSAALAHQASERASEPDNDGSE